MLHTISREFFSSAPPLGKGWPFYTLWEGSPSPSWALACPWSLPWDQLSWVRFRQDKEHPMSLHKSWFEISDCEYRTDNDRSHILRTVFHCDGFSLEPQKWLLDMRMWTDPYFFSVLPENPHREAFVLCQTKSIRGRDKINKLLPWKTSNSQNF